MKHLLHKLSIAGGLLASATCFSQAALEDEIRALENQLNQLNDDSMVQSNRAGDFKEIQYDRDIKVDKTYGDGGYSIILSASSAASVNLDGDSVYAGGGCIYQGTGPGFDAYDIPLHIPSGHEILGMRYAFNDTSASSSQAIIYSVDGTTGAFTTEHSVVSTGDTGYGSIYNQLVGGLLVDNLNTKYTVRFLPNEAGATQQMCALRIEVNSTPAP